MSKKNIFLFLHPKTISTAELGEDGTLIPVRITGKSQASCETTDDVDLFCDYFIRFYGVDLLVELEANYFIIDAGANQERRARLLLNFKKCSHVSSLFIEEALPLLLLGKMGLPLNAPVNLSYKGKGYRLFEQEGIVQVESCDLSPESHTMAIRNEDFLSLVQPVAITQVSGREEDLRLAKENLRLAKAEIAELRKRIQSLEEELEEELKEEKGVAPKELSLTDWNKGNQICFGQKEWLILERQENRALIIAKDAIAVQRFDIAKNNWERSEIRAYLNGEFYHQCFTPEEQRQIIETELKTENSISKEHIFLLSVVEAEWYFNSDKERLCHSEGKACWYWLRSPGGSSIHAAIVFSDGSLVLGGYSVGNTAGAVRPALWVNIEA